MRTAIIGTGYVGLVSGTCFAEMGTDVVCVDINEQKIEKLNCGQMPIYEPGLKDLIVKNVREKRLRFTTDIAGSIRHADIVFCAVGTPPDEDGSADLQYVLDVAKVFGDTIEKYTLFVTKSTVPVGTADKVRKVIEQRLQMRSMTVDFDVASNPEFLKEGAAIKDFMAPDRVVVGVDSDRARSMIEKLYRPFDVNGYPIIFMDIPSAEMTKYAANAMLATRISFMNEIANLCERVGADVDNVRRGIGSDRRIGSQFLFAGCGYGGSCFPKDVKALSRCGESHGYRMTLVEAVEQVNARQKEVLFDKLVRRMPDLAGKRIAVWGLAFKPETDDMREAPSLVLIERLKQAGACIVAFDPIAMEEARRRIGDTICYAGNIYEAVDDADALVLVTEWKEFRMPDWKKIRAGMRGNLIIDGRNMYDHEELAGEGFDYVRIGKA